MNINYRKYKYAIIGLGLIGGSVVKALNHRFGTLDITVVDKNLSFINEALIEGTITRGFSCIDNHLLDADIIFICTPVKDTIKYIKDLYPKIKQNTIITDVGSTKDEIMSYVEKLPKPFCFIGGHPMTGSEKTGYKHSSPHLFENAYYVLTPSNNADDQSIQILETLIHEVGGIPLIIDATTHDKITAGISHVPHIIATILVNMVKQIDCLDGKMRMLAAGGFKDITRIASSNPLMWQSIVLSNNLPIREILLVFAEQLNEFIGFIDDTSEKEILGFFESAKNYRDSFSANRKGLISSMYEITVDVADQPGIIGDIATILGNNNINIKNINVSNSREFEQGCIIISLSDGDSVDTSLSLLNSNGYKAFKRE